MENIFIAPAIKAALEKNQPVVALESTIISHGMPFPKNVETALAVEEVVRQNGALPATIGIIDGKFIVGLSVAEINLLGQIGTKAQKVSRRDLAVVMARKQHGATTVAATMIIAEAAGIKIFATGGIGGVHRGAEKTMDISADLQELSQTNVTVISAGVKSILDIGLTLEYLETQGVLVIGYQTDEMPAFYSRKSGHKLTNYSNSAREIAEIIKAKEELNLAGGIVVANPIPAESEIEYSAINIIIEEAIQALKAQKITGKETTPFLLSKIVELSQGESLEANIKLIKNNAKLASQIACQLG